MGIITIKKELESGEKGTMKYLKRLWAYPDDHRLIKQHAIESGMSIADYINTIAKMKPFTEKKYDKKKRWDFVQ